MKKTLSTLLISISIIVLYGQNSSFLSVSYDRYFNSNIDFTRKNGITIGYSYEIPINDFVSMNLGLSPKIIQEVYTNIEGIVILYTDENWDSLLIGYEVPKGVTICADLPFEIKTNLYKSKLFLLSGVNLSFERLVNFSAFELADPEIDNRSFPKRKISFGYSFGLLYALNKRFEFFGDFKTNINKDYSFNNYSVGIRMNLTNH